MMQGKKNFLIKKKKKKLNIKNGKMIKMIVRNKPKLGGGGQTLPPVKPQINAKTFKNSFFYLLSLVWAGIRQTPSELLWIEAA